MNIKRICIVIFIILIGIGLTIYYISRAVDSGQTSESTGIPDTQKTLIQDGSTSLDLDDVGKQGYVNSDQVSDSMSKVPIENGHGILLNNVPDIKKTEVLDFEIINKAAYLKDSKINYILTVKTTYDDVEYKFDIEVGRSSFDGVGGKGSQFRHEVGIIEIAGKIFMLFVENILFF